MSRSTSANISGSQEAPNTRSASERARYRATLIIPVYNVRKYLAHCFRALEKQTIDMNSVEILLVNDGSTDDSEAICRRYADKHDNVRLFTKQNEGLSATRNLGIRNAQGKYIFYLDADDTYSNETIENVCNFFDEHYDEVDEVTFPIVRYKRGKRLRPHYRYQYLRETGIYDLNEYPYISQTNINVCVKNEFESNVLFDTTPGFRQEDQKYNNDILRKKLKIGFVKDAEYKYNRDNNTSIVNTFLFPYYAFETSMGYFEQLFDSFDGHVPRYFQTMFINDINWKLQEDKLYPYHYGPEEFNRANSRIQSLLAKCDDATLVEHPKIDNFHTQYWLQQKPNAHPVPFARPGKIDILLDGHSIYNRDFVEIGLQQIRVSGGEARVMGFVKSPVFNCFNDTCALFVSRNGNEPEPVPVKPSVHDYHKNHFVKTNRFYAFDYSFETSAVDELVFTVRLDGNIYRTEFFFLQTAGFDLKHDVRAIIRERTSITTDGASLRFKHLTPSGIDEFQKRANMRYRNYPYARMLRAQALRYRRNHKVWLYVDSYSVEKDNAYLQFQNDFAHGEEDGIERYYLTFSHKNDHLFTAEQKRHLVRFGSPKHQLLYLSAERIFTAYYGRSTISPFPKARDEENYQDLFQAKVVYLQHGVLHAALRAYNSAERCRAEQIVVSSRFEVGNYVGNYNYREEDLIPTGMARYDFIDRMRAPQRRILYAPSWRKYLTVENTPSNWTLVKDKLIDSDYFKGILNLVNSKELEHLLAKHGVALDVKLHPIIANSAASLLPEETAHVSYLSGSASVEDYAMFITDFSSFVFDFACLNRPIAYYVTDYEQFRSGMNHYKELDLEFEDAFGPLCLSVNDIVQEIERAIRNDFESEEPYAARMSGFYVNIDNCRERLYEYVMNHDRITEARLQLHEKLLQSTGDQG